VERNRKVVFVDRVPNPPVGDCGQRRAEIVLNVVSWVTLFALSTALLAIAFRIERFRRGTTSARADLGSGSCGSWRETRAARLAEGASRCNELPALRALGSGFGHV
jgi:hypothetical protein